MNLEPVPDIPAIVIDGNHRWVCVADLHLGLEAQLRRSGFNIPSQTAKMLSSLEQLATHGSRLLILGDIKHKIPAVSYREDREIPPFLGRLSEKYESITIVAGNHDGGLASILPEGIHAFPGKGTLLEGLGVFHGHVWPSKEAMRSKTVLMGHIHPSVLLKDSLGAKTNEKCWVRARLLKKKVLERYEDAPGQLIVIPAFNPLLTGTPINGSRGLMLGPMFRNELVDPRSLRVYLLDGTDLGRPMSVA